MRPTTTAPRRRPGVLAPIALLVGLALAGGCVGKSSPTRFYVLNGSSKGPNGAGRGPALGVGPVTLPAYLERPNIVTRQGAKVEVAEFDRWSEPLADGVPRSLVAHLAEFMQTERILRFPWPGDESIEHQVVIDVSRFDGTVGGEVVLDARWRVLGPDRKELVLRRSVVRQSTGEGGYIGVVAAMDRSLATLSEEIALSLKELGWQARLPAQAGGR